MDRLHNNPSRVSTEVLSIQANYLHELALENMRKQHELGQLSYEALKQAEAWKFDEETVYRWRKKFGVTERTVNLRVKLSRKKRNRRVRAYWCNVIRMQALHKKLYPESKLRFAGFDQKPFYFNSSIAQKTLARAGTRRVRVNENVADSRERFTTVGVPVRHAMELDTGSQRVPFFFPMFWK